MSDKFINFLKALKKTYKDPKKKAIIKLSFYIIFFMILFISAAIINNSESKLVENKEEEKETIKDNYATLLTNLVNNNQNINYIIKNNDIEYKINGTIKDKILEGYLESNTEIKKILLKDNILYEIDNETYVQSSIDFNHDLINIYYIFNILDQNRPYIEATDYNKIYTYNIIINDVDTNIKVFTNLKKITSIEIEFTNLWFNLNFIDI